MSLTSKLKRIRDTLLTVCDNVNHYVADNKMGDYIVWSEDGFGDTLYADNNLQEFTISGTVDLFTKTEYSELIDNLHNAMYGLCISFILETVQYEEETNIIHYTWRFEI